MKNRRSIIYGFVAIAFVVLFMVAIFCGGDDASRTVDLSTATEPASGQTTDEAAAEPPSTSEQASVIGTPTGFVINDSHQNPARVDIVFDRLIAPDFYVGYGLIGGSFEMFLDNPERWDPLGIGVERIMDLELQLRQNVLGLSEEIHARSYELSFEIIESHLHRKDEVIAEVIAYCSEFYGVELTDLDQSRT